MANQPKQQTDLIKPTDMFTSTLTSLRFLKSTLLPKATFTPDIVTWPKSANFFVRKARKKCCEDNSYQFWQEFSWSEEFC